jgi:murein DD-endopeptidase MepM/ murein hydrolase activator NlpD
MKLMFVFRGYRPWFASLLILALLAVNLPAVGQVSRDDLDEARRRRDEASVRLDDAVAVYDTVYGELATVTFRLGQFEDRITSYESEIRDLHNLVQAQAIAAFKAGNVSDVGVIFGVDSLTELITGRQFLERAAQQELSLLDRLSSVRNGLEATRERLLEDQQRFLELEKEQGDLVAEIGSLFGALETEFEELRSEFEEAERLRREEERRKRLTALALLEGATAGASAQQTTGFVCLFNSLYRFVNDWGQPRSGGRTHKGTDIVAPFGHPVVAVATGSIIKRNSDLGGASLWLDADNGTSYYYAHLSGYADGLSDGSRVSAGQVVAYNGDSGNAKGGVPHVHFQVHPGGRGNNPVNPYPTLVEHCN